MRVKVSDLPAALRDALASVGYHCADVEVRASETYSMSTGGSSNGRRAFAVAVDLATGASEVHRGSWGGPNPFNPKNAVDLDQTARSLPPNFAVIHGSEGGQVHARVEVHPDTLRPLLPPTVELTESERMVLRMHAGLTSAGRKRQIEAWCLNAGRKMKSYREADATVRAAVAAIVDRLVARGLLARNKAGAVSVTTEGKNAAGDRPSQGLGSFDFFPTA